MLFTKMQGAGNDYVYVDCITHAPPREPAKLSQVISDRHFGVGSDGLIMICPSEKADVRMRMFNADGSESEMCGNGVRCVAKYAYDHGLSSANPMQVETGRGVLTLHLQIRSGKVERVTVDMGEPILEAERIPTTLPGPRSRRSAPAAQRRQLVYRLRARSTPYLRVDGKPTRDPLCPRCVAQFRWR